jgi:hypothetical protein
MDNITPIADLSAEDRGLREKARKWGKGGHEKEQAKGG